MSTQANRVFYTDKDGQQVNFGHETWRTVDAYFKCTPHPHKDPVSIQKMGARLAEPQIAPYDQALDTIRDIILRNDPVVTYGGIDRQNPTLKLEVAFKEVKYDENPIVHGVHGITERLTPAIARRLSMTYATTIFVDLQYTLSVKNEQGQWEANPPRIVADFQLGKIPIMLGSRLDNGPGRIPGFAHQAGECQFDCGGYYIITGLEKVTVAREKMIENYPMVFEVTESSSQKYTDECVVRSVPDEGRYHGDCSIKVFLRNTPSEGQINVKFGNLKNEIPLFTVFRALGVAVDQDIFKMCVHDLEDEEMIELLMPSLQEAKETPSVEAARRYLAGKLQSNTSNGDRATPAAPLSDAAAAQAEARAFQYLDNSFIKYLYPHVGDNFEHKAAYLGHCVYKLLSCVLRRRNYDDRDHMGFKKIETSGVLLANLFHQVFKNKVLIEMKHELHRALTQPLGSRPIQDSDIEGVLHRIIKSNVLDPIRVAFMTSKWGYSKSNAAAAIKQGVSQQLQRINNKGAISHVRKLVTPIDSGNSKAVAGPHKLHGSQYGFICPAETPDGEQIGITKHLALTSTFTVYTDSNLVRDALSDLGLVRMDQVLLDMNVLLKGHKVFLNGRWEGVHTEPERLVQTLRKYRRNGVLHPHTGVFWNIMHREVCIWTTGGRIVRPLYIVDQPGNRLRMTQKVFTELAEGKLGWDDLVGGVPKLSAEGQLPTLDPEALEDTAYLEYVDTQEAENIMVAMTIEDLQANRADDTADSYIEFTHAEIHPALMLSAVIGDIPFPNHCQSPRVIYWGNMGRQSIGYHATNYKQRMDTVSYQLHYPQLPLVSTRASRYAMSRELPAGQMAIIAIACYTGYNQEDSTIICADSIDRGLFLRTVRKVHKDEEKKNYGEATEEQIRYPDKNTAQMKSNYDAIDPETGLPIRGRYVKNGDVILSKIVKTKGTKDSMVRYRDISVYLRHGEEGVIDNVEMSTTGEGYKCVRISIRQERIPQIGDKFANRSSQKGTLGILLNKEDMPYTKDGLTPDLIINPHCLAEDHEILTEHGFMGLEEVKAGYENGTLRVAGFDPVTEHLVYEKPTQFILNEAKPREMIEFVHHGEADPETEPVNNAVSLLVTTDHDMYAKTGMQNEDGSMVWDGVENDYEKMPASKLIFEDARRTVKFLGRTKAGIQSEMSILDAVPFARCLGLSDGNVVAFLEVYGYFMGDGTLRLGGNSIEMNPVKETDRVWLQSRFEALGLMEGVDFTYSITGSASIMNTEWFGVFSNLPEITSGVKPEGFASWVWNLPIAGARAVLAGLRYADGCENGICTSSVRMRDEIVRFAFHAGYSPNFVLQHMAGQSVANHDNWQITYTETARQSEPVLHANRDIKKVMYDGRTWCVTMPHGFIITRRAHRNEEGVVMKASRPIITGQCMPSRMTVSMLMEILYGKVCAIKGVEGDGTPFNGTQIEDIAKILGTPVEKGGCGMTEITRPDGEFGWGHEVMYSGFTGEQFPVRIFTGPCFYVSLKHMVDDKIHARSTGMVQPISRQPAEGRSRDGGLRLGEMERDVLIAHGAASFLQDKMLLCSDLYECWIDKATGTIAIGDPDKNTLREGTEECLPVAIPWSLKTLLQELMSIGIKTHIKLA